jgi:hypothetical protein
MDAHQVILTRASAQCAAANGSNVLCIPFMFTQSGPAKTIVSVDLISDALPFGRLRYGEPNAVANAIGYAKHRSRSHDAVIRVYDEAGNVIETHEHKSDFKEW